MTNLIYIAVEGTCTAGPDENLLEIIEEIESGKRKRRFDPELNRPVSGGSTVLLIKSSQGTFVIDSGDLNDREVLERSLASIAQDGKFDPRAADRVYLTHAHPDHNGNHDLFPGATWLYQKGDDLIAGVLGVDVGNYDPSFKELYSGHKDRGIIQGRFTPVDLTLPTSTPADWESFEASGHSKSDIAYLIRGPSVVVNEERGTEVETGRVLVVGDCICDPRYWNRFRSDDPDVQATGVYGNRIPDAAWMVTDHDTRAKMAQQNIISARMLIDLAREGGYVIFGHSGAFPAEQLLEEANPQFILETYTRL